MTLPDPHHDRQFYDGVPTRRLVAFVLDLVVVAAVMALALIGGAVLGFFTAGIGALLGVALFFASGFLYRYLMISRKSATLGMMAAGIELRDRQGHPLDEVTSFIHTIGFYASLLFPLVMIAGVFWMMASPYRRLAHDILPGTAAINRPL